MINKFHMINIIILVILISIICSSSYINLSITENFSTKIYKFIKIRRNKNNKNIYKITTFDNKKSHIAINNHNNSYEYQCTFDTKSINFKYMNDSRLKFTLDKMNIEIEHRNKTKFIKISINEDNNDYDTIFYFHKDIFDNKKINYYILDQIGNEVGYIEYKSNHYLIITDSEYFKYINMIAIAFIFYLNDL